MTIKIALLKSGESVIADIKELIQEEKICGYLFKKPYAVNLSPTYGFLTEEISEDNVEDNVEDNINVSFSPWIPLTQDEEIPVRYDWLVTVVNPIDDVKTLYEEMIGGKTN